MALSLTNIIIQYFTTNNNTIYKPLMQMSKKIPGISPGENNFRHVNALILRQSVQDPVIEPSELF